MESVSCSIIIDEKDEKMNYNYIQPRGLLVLQEDERVRKCMGCQKEFGWYCSSIIVDIVDIYFVIIVQQIR